MTNFKKYIYLAIAIITVGFTINDCLKNKKGSEVVKQKVKITCCKK